MKLGLARVLGAAVALIWAHAALAQSSRPVFGRDLPATSPTTRGIGSEPLDFPRLVLDEAKEGREKWLIHPTGDQKLCTAIRKIADINIEPGMVGIADAKELRRHRMLFLTSDADFALKDEDAARLREYLLAGGFLYADDCVANATGDNFYKAMIREFDTKVFPESHMAPVPTEHSIYGCFFKLSGAPFLQGTRHPTMAVFEPNTGRLMVLLTSGDVHCGWVGFGNLAAVERQHAIEFGVNVVVYALSH